MLLQTIAQRMRRETAPLRNFGPSMSALVNHDRGSRNHPIAHVRLAPKADNEPTISSGPLCATSGHWPDYSITSSARSRKGTVPFRRLRWHSTCVIVGSTPQWTYDMASDEEVERQILSIFMQHKVGASGVLRRNNFIDVRDADFQRGLNKAVENRWIKVKLRDRYTYELTEAGLAAGLNARLPSKPLG